VYISHLDRTSSNSASLLFDRRSAEDEVSVRQLVNVMTQRCRPWWRRGEAGIDSFTRLESSGGDASKAIA
jgi:hypothetical protein